MTGWWWFYLTVVALTVPLGGWFAWRVCHAPQPEAPARDVPDAEQVTLAPYETATIAVLEQVYGNKQAARIAAERERQAREAAE